MPEDDKEETFDLDKILPAELSLNDILTTASRKAWKPRISHLPDAVVDGKLVVKVGDRLLVEYGNEDYRDTICWVVSAIYNETLPTRVHREEVIDESGESVFKTTVSVVGTTCAPGHVRLFDPMKAQFGATNYLTAHKHGIVLKVPDKSRKWTIGEEEPIKQRRKRRFVKDET